MTYCTLKYIAKAENAEPLALKTQKADASVKTSVPFYS